MAGEAFRWGRGVKLALSATVGLAVCAGLVLAGEWLAMRRMAKLGFVRHTMRRELLERMKASRSRGPEVEVMWCWHGPERN